jgi:hypothetical protein
MSSAVSADVDAAGWQNSNFQSDDTLERSDANLYEQHLSNKRNNFLMTEKQ